MVKPKKVSDIVADFLKEKKIEVVFGIIGSANAHIFDSIVKLGYTKIVNMHHEQSVVLAMGAYYRTSGKPSAALVTAGGGASNAVTGVVSNWADSIPGIIISGQEPTTYLKNHKNLRMYGTQGFDIVGMLKDVTKYGVTIFDANTIEDELEKSFEISNSGRPGPCWVDIPLDIQSSNIIPKGWKPISETTPYSVDVSEILNLIHNSNRPVIVGGNGVKLSGGKDEFVKFINKVKIPTLLTWSGIDMLPDTHPSFYGRFGIYGQRCANFIIQNSDLIVVLGSRLSLPQVGYDFSQFAREAKIVVVDIDDIEAGKYTPSVYMNEDCLSVLKSLNSSEIVDNDISEWVSYCETMKLKYPWVSDEHIDNGYINSYRFIDKLSEYLSDNHVIVTDMGTGLLSGHQSIKIKDNQIMFTSQGLGEMGYGLPAAIGAQMSKPNNPVLCLNCDGGIMMNLQELHTIVENELPIKIIIFNNDGYLMIKHTQKLFFNSKYVSVDKKTGVGLPNFSKLMPAFGYEYFSLSEWDSFEDTILSFLNYPTMAVLEVFMDPYQDFIPKVKGVLKSDNTIMAPPIEEMSPILPILEIESSMLIGVSYKSKEMKR
jgi:acetolactate synthase I/II/III large subunit